MSIPSDIPQQPTAIPYRIAGRDLCESDAFAHFASHGTEEEKEDFKLARKLMKRLMYLTSDFKNGLNTYILVGLHSKEPQIWNNNLEFFNSFASEHAVERLNLSDALKKECQEFYNQRTEDVRVEKPKSNKKVTTWLRTLLKHSETRTDVRQFNWTRFKRTNGSDGKVTYRNDKDGLIIYGYDFKDQTAVKPRYLGVKRLADLEDTIRSKKAKIGRVDEDENDAQCVEFGDELQ
ncbi:hypothetical protein BJV82DRAFT_662386 [Fennellomyces sp. T-0311]|nr:hypothetical protein BJV82DRAFT_662386 [Fennellomyces sp. T-0311]